MRNSQAKFSNLCARTYNSGCQVHFIRDSTQGYTATIVSIISNLLLVVISDQHADPISKKYVIFKLDLFFGRLCHCHVYKHSCLA